LVRAFNIDTVTVGPSVNASDTVLVVGESIWSPFRDANGVELLSLATEATEGDRRGRFVSGLFCSLLLRE
jgi:hypothetical protein